MKRTVAFSKNATNLFFHILTRCNLRCRHCYINPAQHGRETLPLATITRWLALFAGKSQTTNVIFLGGEPTLHPDLAQAVQSARRLGYQSVTIDTNGYLFHDILARVTPAEVDYFSFSLDGASAPANDRIRGEGSYAACTAGIRSAAAAGFATSVIFTVSRDNLDELQQMPPLLQTLGVERFFIQVIGVRGQSARGPAAAQGPTGPQVSRQEWCQTVPAVAARAAALGITVSYPKVFLDPGEPFACAGRVACNYFIFPNGRVYRCPLCEDYPLHSLMIADDTLRETGGINEAALFQLDIPEGCVMNKLIQPGNLAYDDAGRPLYRVACCLLKEELSPD
ncbi:MAG: radical SAM protein [Desulfobacterales bacterium]|nr:radical SAM protein [Desulfobacterales bacterium]